MQVGTIRISHLSCALPEERAEDALQRAGREHDSGARPGAPARGGVVGTTSVPSQPLGPAQTRLRRVPITQPHP
jgi:hypothetical protein